MSNDRDHLVGQLTTRAQKIQPKSLVKLWKCLILFHHQPTMQYGEVEIGGLKSRFIYFQIFIANVPNLIGILA